MVYVRQRSGLLRQRNRFKCSDRHRYHRQSMPSGWKCMDKYGKTLRQATQGEFAFEQAPQWIWHDSIAYLFPQGNNIKLKMDRQKGNWAKSISIILLRKSACRYSIWSLITDNLPETHLTHISLYRESTTRKK